MTLATTFWISLGLVGYAYVGYPVIVMALARLRPRPIRRAPATPAMTVVIAAHNEERHIAAKLANCLTLAYPTERLDVVVVSDGSTDRTPAIVQEHADRFPGRVTLVSFPSRRGKAAALNAGVAQASGEIVLLADARQPFDPEVARTLAENLADPEVGAVSGALMLRPLGTEAHEKGLGLYWRYEKAIRQAESRWGSSMGYTGAVSAIRRSLFEPLAENILLDDLVTPLRLIAKGYRVAFEPCARAYDTVAARPGHEFGRKVRTLAGVVQVCLNTRTLVGRLPARIWWQLVSHKILRILVPYFLIVILITSMFLRGPVYRAMLLGQGLLYALAVVGLVARGRLGRSRLLAIPATFLLLNAAAVVAAFRYVMGGRLDLWRATVSGPSLAATVPGSACADLSGANVREREPIR